MANIRGRPVVRSHLLVSNVNDGKRSRMSTYTAGDIIDVRPAGFEFGIREDVETWVKAGNKRSEFPNSFIIIDLEISYAKAKMLQTSNFFPMRVSNYNLDFNRLPASAKREMSLDVKDKKMTSGKTRHALTAGELDDCLLPRFGKKKPSDF